MITVWGRKTSQNVFKVMWLLAELDLPHRRIDTGGRYGGLDTPEFGAMNPNRKVPVIKDGELVLWESHSILRYLSARYGAGTFWPGDPAERALVDRWTDWCATALQPAFMDLFWGYFRTPPEQRDWAFINSALDRTIHLFGLMDEVLSRQPWLSGERLTMGDIPAACTIHRWYSLDLAKPRFAHVEAWFERLQERSAYREHVMVPFEELRGRLAF
ncbi:glutathione S-transferase [Iodidimonas sp. SYSU 1G8]|uniref:glutathione S-transferase family protein n=1 Tax=Iodidimonas sp. SYSU 1G8 TaxID=3133967 RepID=UPI0031FE6936